MTTTESTRPPIAILIILTAVPLMSLNLFLPSLVEMAVDFRVDYETISLSVSVYLATTAVLQMLIGPLSDRYGRRPVLLAGLLLFACASIGCSLSTEFHWFIAFRILQGAIICGAVLSRAIVSDMAEPREAAGILGYIGMAMSLVPILGPVAGGFIGDAYGWRASFWLLTGSGLAVWLLIWRSLPETTTSRPQSSVELLRAYRHLVANSSFWAYTAIMTLSVGAFFIFISGVPLIASSQLEMSQAQIGLCIGTITIGFLLGNFLSTRFAALIPLDRMILIGRLVPSIALVGGFLHLVLGSVSALTVFGTTIFVGIGNGLTMPGANSCVMAVRKDLAGSASGLAGAVFTLGGGCLTMLTGALLSRSPDVVVLVGLMLAVTLLGLSISIWTAWRRPLFAH